MTHLLKSAFLVLLVIICTCVVLLLLFQIGVLHPRL